jgi:hypothetical protein
LIQHGSEEVEQRSQPRHIHDHPDDLEMKFIHVLGELGTKPPLAVLHLQSNLGLILDHLSDHRIGEEITNPLLVVAIDDERFVKLRLTHLDVLHS